MRFPVLIEPAENGIDDPIDAFDVGEHDHRSGASPDFDEAAFDGVGRAQLAPQVPWEREEGLRLSSHLRM